LQAPVAFDPGLHRTSPRMGRSLQDRRTDDLQLSLRRRLYPDRAPGQRRLPVGPVLPLGRGAPARNQRTESGPVSPQRISKAVDALNDSARIAYTNPKR